MGVAALVTGVVGLVVVLLGFILPAATDASRRAAESTGLTCAAIAAMLAVVALGLGIVARRVASRSNAPKTLANSGALLGVLAVLVAAGLGVYSVRDRFVTVGGASNTFDRVSGSLP